MAPAQRITPKITPSRFSERSRTRNGTRHVRSSGSEFGTPADVVLEYGDEHEIDRIVLGSHCRSEAERFPLGSGTETVVKRAAVPVLIVR
ncbi:universal stress protein [Natrialbaceae archaeon A-CW3]